MIPEPKYNALIALIDDDEVFTHVCKEFRDHGHYVIPQLLATAETYDSGSVVHQRLFDIVAQIRRYEFLERYQQHGEIDLVDAWIQICLLRDTQLNVDEIKNKFNQIVERCRPAIKPEMSLVEQLAAIVTVVYRQDSYNGNFKDPDNVNNCFLDQILKHKYGNSLSMSMFFYAIAQALRVDVHIINFGGYIALHCHNDKDNFYLDAYNKGLFFTGKQVSGFLQKMNADPDPNVYPDLEPSQSIQLLLEFIVKLYEHHGQKPEARKYSAFSVEL